MAPTINAVPPEVTLPPWMVARVVFPLRVREPKVWVTPIPAVSRSTVMFTVPATVVSRPKLVLESLGSSNVVPFLIESVPVPSAQDLVTRSVTALIVVLPEQVLLAERIQVPAPVLVTAVVLV